MSDILRSTQVIMPSSYYCLIMMFLKKPITPELTYFESSQLYYGSIVMADGNYHQTMYVWHANIIHSRL